MAVVVTGLCAHAQQDEATKREQALNSEGISLVQAGKHAEAIAKFKEAERLVPRHAHDCNISQAYAEQRRLPQAWLFLERCAARMGPNPEAWVKTQLAELDQKLKKGPYAPITIRVEPSSATLVVPTLAADEAWQVLGRKTLWLPQGRVALAVSAPGWVTERRELVLTTAAPLELAFRLLEPKAVTPPPPQSPPVVAETKQRTLWPVAPLVLGVISSGVGGGLLLSGNGAAGRIGSAMNASEAFSLAGQAGPQQSAGVAMLVGGVVVAAVGLLLFLVL